MCSSRHDNFTCRHYFLRLILLLLRLFAEQIHVQIHVLLIVTNSNFCYFITLWLAMLNMMPLPCLETHVSPVANSVWFVNHRSLLLLRLFSEAKRHSNLTWT
jgi:hypothetical protein